VIDFAVAVVVLTFPMCTAMEQMRGALSRGLSYINLDILTLIRSLIVRRWSMFDVVNKNVQLHMRSLT